jgi:hypothetical protein
MERNTNLKSNKAASKAKKPGVKPVEPNARDYVQQQLSSMGKLILQAEKLILDAAGKGNCSLSFFPGGAHQRKVIYCILGMKENFLTALCDRNSFCAVPHF